MKLSSYLKLFICLICLSVLPCYAVYKAPINQNTTLTAKFDKIAVPSRLTVWGNLSGGVDDSDILKWQRNSLQCLSSTDDTYGACRTAPVWWSEDSAPFTPESITLLFKLDGSTTRIPLVLKGTHQAGPCDTVKSSVATSCIDGKENNNDFTFYIPQSELTRLTQPGTWRATLKQALWQWSPRQVINNWTANIILTVTDLNSQQIYFPAFPHAAPRINLNLSNLPGTNNNTMASGSAFLDMCLYDGSNSSSNHVSMIFTDEGASATGRQNGLFSVYRTGSDKSLTANRVDYQVSVINPTTGAPQTVSNGTEISWTNTNRRNIQRQVVLPGVSGVSLCVPAPITLATPAFKLADKAAGQYSGKLTIIYTPSTQTNVGGDTENMPSL